MRVAEESQLNAEVRWMEGPVADPLRSFALLRMTVGEVEVRQR